ncbi:hypothetical protein RvY_12445 [Ramazzottius varieornatus]|uniref:G-protein coupled receptors family 1 profile domain-containing protein n=1 Tax=Ramazzottius varieornatus TaxID=947166 RepID=A0A1D1VT96_RAMVA|nr:hypothetical protein RvY_12445 [Ramazzottius varieornatus]
MNDSVDNETEVYKWAFGPTISGLLIADTTLSVSFSVLVNSIIIIAVITDSKLHHNKFWYGLSLAVADLIGTLNLGFGCYNILYDGWPVQNRPLCKFWSCIDFTSGLIASLTIALISFDQYKLVRYPDIYEQEETGRRVAGRIISVWIFAILFYFPPVIFWDMVVGYSVVAIDQCDPEFKEVFWATVFQSVVEFFIPFTVILVYNYKLIKFIRGQLSKVHYLKQELKKVPRESTIFTMNSAEHEKIEARIFERERIKEEIRSIDVGRKNARSLIILVLLFFCVWFPWEVIGNLVEPICKCTPDDLYQAVYWLNYHLVVVNAIVYGLTVQRVRYHIKRLFVGCASTFFRKTSHRPKEASKSTVTPSREQ